MNLCKTCSNAIFDPVWGEYKCSIKHVYTSESVDCPDYKKGNPKETEEPYFDRETLTDNVI